MLGHSGRFQVSKYTEPASGRFPYPGHRTQEEVRRVDGLRYQTPDGRYGSATPRPGFIDTRPNEPVRSLVRRLWNEV
jgi:hypothetical protein